MEAILRLTVIRREAVRVELPPQEGREGFLFIAGRVTLTSGGLESAVKGYGGRVAAANRMVQVEAVCMVEQAETEERAPRWVAPQAMLPVAVAVAGIHKDLHWHQALAASYAFGGLFNENSSHRRQPGRQRN